MIGKEANEIIQKLFDSTLQKYRKGLKEKMKRSEFSFDFFFFLMANVCRRL